MRPLLLLVAVTACYSANPEVGIPCSGQDFACPTDQFCDFNRQPPTCVKVALDAAIDAALACTPSNNTCPMDSPVCDSSTMTCRRCVADADCPSNVCHESAGTCVADPSTVVWVRIGGDDAGMCTEMMPCNTIGRAIAVADATRNFIRIEDGQYQQQLSISKSVILSGISRPAAARITAGGFGPVITLNGTGTTVTFETLVVSQGPNTGINANTGTILKVFGAKIDGNQSHGITGSGATLEIRQTQISSNSRGVEALNNSTLLVNRTTFRTNRDHAIRANQSKYDVTSSLFIDNARGVALENGLVAGSKLEHCTFVGTTNDRSIRCNDQGHTIGNSIVTTGQSPLIDNRCTVRYSVTTEAVPGVGNMTGDPGFVSPTDFHLAPGSRAVDTADPASTEPTDYDGTTRPRGVRRDIGAYEL